MQQKYLYQSNGFITFFKGFLNFGTGKRQVFPYYDPTKQYVWRNDLSDGYKIGDSY